MWGDGPSGILDYHDETRKLAGYIFQMFWQLKQGHTDSRTRKKASRFDDTSTRRIAVGGDGSTAGSKDFFR